MLAAEIGGYLVEVWAAAVLGVVEGVTEFLPVSSTGHLLIVQRWLGIPTDEASNAFAIVIQGGAILAVLGLYRQRIARIFAGVLRRDPVGARLARALLVAFAPAAIVGIATVDVIERTLFRPWPIVVAWAVGGVVLLAIGRRVAGRPGSGLEEMTVRVALWIGIAQIVALWPGVSRSLATILGGLAAGLSMVAAVEFSFLLGLVTLGAATVFELVDSGAALFAAYTPTAMAVGLVASFVSALVAVRWMVAWLSRRGLGVFGVWRLVAAGATALALLAGGR